MEEPTTLDIDDFIARWRFTEGSERANKDSFLKDLCRALGVPEPNGKTGDPERDSYVFEADAVVYAEGERRSTGKMDLYKHGCFVLEAKQGSEPRSKKVGTARRNTPGWSAAMQHAMGQAFGYARTLEQPPPFVIVTDIGYCFDLYACFDGTTAYRPFPNGQRSRHYYSDLSRHADILRAIWLNPMDLDPTRRAETVTREIAERLAELAGELEGAGYSSDRVARFLMRCVFCMFAEDIGLLRDQVFTKALEKHWIPDPASFKEGVESLWDAMNEGKKFFTLGKLLHFNGGLFAQPEALPLNGTQLKILREAARHEWSDVQPAIFGTLIERALNPAERDRLGSHFTPTAYVERLLVPTVEEPLREQWDLVRVQVRQLVPPNEPAKPNSVKKARALVEEFHRILCDTTVLDPACGSGNFLYLALNLFKRLESEVLAALYDLGIEQQKLRQDMLVTPKQFRGIEVRRESKEIAELVLWIGYLQWHHRMYGQTKSPPEPVLKDYKNIECRDALLECDSSQIATDRKGKPLSRWDGITMKRHPTTDNDVPDDRARVPVLQYTRPRPAEWPKANYVVGNPPFIGNKLMRTRLGDGYVDALRQAYPDVSEASDLVMYWWERAAALTRAHKIHAFGLITTNSITQSYNRAGVEKHCTAATNPISVRFAIPDHPWVDSGDASVRIAMTVCTLDSQPGRLVTATACGVSAGNNLPSELHFNERIGRIHSNLTIGADTTSTKPLRANQGLSFMGVTLGNQGFVLKEGDEHWGGNPSYVRPLIIGRDLNRKMVPKRVIDLTGLSESAAARRAPGLFQHVLLTVKPDRDQQRRKSYKEKWWLFLEARSRMRAALTGLEKYIVTCRTASHRVFSFVDSRTVAESTVVAIASDDPFVLGVLSSRIHRLWALRAGGTLEDRPRYNNSLIFDPFPFPDASARQKRRVADIAQRIDDHRKSCQQAHPGLTITDIYNVLEKSRLGAAELSRKEKATYRQGLVALLERLHSDLDQAVFETYGWDRNLTDDELVARLVSLNQQRVFEEASGTVKYLRREFQRPSSAPRAADMPIAVPQVGETLPLTWPEQLPQQVAAVRDLIVASGAALTANDVASSYRGATSKAVVPALDTLVALGMAASFSDGERQWKALARTTGERAPADGMQTTSSHPPPSEQLRTASG